MVFSKSSGPKKSVGSANREKLVIFFFAFFGIKKKQLTGVEREKIVFFLLAAGKKKTLLAV